MGNPRSKANVLFVARRSTRFSARKSSLSSFTLVIHQRSHKQLSELLTVSEVARILRVDDTTVRRWVKNGVLEAVILPHVNQRQGYRIKRETLDKLLGKA